MAIVDEDIIMGDADVEMSALGEDVSFRLDGSEVDKLDATVNATPSGLSHTSASTSTPLPLMAPFPSLSDTPFPFDKDTHHSESLAIERGLSLSPRSPEVEFGSTQPRSPIHAKVDNAPPLSPYPSHTRSGKPRVLLSKSGKVLPMAMATESTPLSLHRALPFRPLLEEMDVPGTQVTFSPEGSDDEPSQEGNELNNINDINKNKEEEEAEVSFELTMAAGPVGFDFEVEGVEIPDNPNADMLNESGPSNNGSSAHGLTMKSQSLSEEDKMEEDLEDKDEEDKMELEDKEGKEDLKESDEESGEATPSVEGAYYDNPRLVALGDRLKVKLPEAMRHCCQPAYAPHSRDDFIKSVIHKCKVEQWKQLHDYDLFPYLAEARTRLRPEDKDKPIKALEKDMRYSVKLAHLIAKNFDPKKPPALRAACSALKKEKDFRTCSLDEMARAAPFLKTLAPKHALTPLIFELYVNSLVTRLGTPAEKSALQKSASKSKSKSSEGKGLRSELEAPKKSKAREKVQDKAEVSTGGGLSSRSRLKGERKSEVKNEVVEKSTRANGRSSSKPLRKELEHSEEVSRDSMKRKRNEFEDQRDEMRPTKVRRIDPRNQVEVKSKEKAKTANEKKKVTPRVKAKEQVKVKEQVKPKEKSIKAQEKGKEKEKEKEATAQTIPTAKAKPKAQPQSDQSLSHSPVEKKARSVRSPQGRSGGLDLAPLSSLLSLPDQLSSFALWRALPDVDWGREVEWCPLPDTSELDSLLPSPPASVLRGVTLILTALRPLRSDFSSGSKSPSHRPRDNLHKVATHIANALGATIATRPPTPPLSRDEDAEDSDMSLGSRPRGLLLALCPTPMRSVRASICAAQRIPLVSVAWLFHCAETLKRVPLTRPYLFPYGQLDNDFVFPRPELAQRLTQADLPFVSREKVGYGLRVEVVGFPEFRKQYSKVLDLAGARVTQRLGSFFESVHCILSDSRPSEATFNSAMRLKVPVFNVQWLQHCLLVGHVVLPRDNAELERFTVMSTVDLAVSRKRLAEFLPEPGLLDPFAERVPRALVTSLTSVTSRALTFALDDPNPTAPKTFDLSAPGADEEALMTVTKELEQDEALDTAMASPDLLASGFQDIESKGKDVEMKDAPIE